MTNEQYLGRYGSNFLVFSYSFKYSLTFLISSTNIVVSTPSTTDYYRSETWVGMTLNELTREYPLDELTFTEVEAK